MVALGRHLRWNTRSSSGKGQRRHAHVAEITTIPKYYQARGSLADNLGTVPPPDQVSLVKAVDFEQIDVVV